MSNFIVFDGQLGSGKTLGAVVFANYLKSKSPNTVLYSNFGMKNAKEFTSLRHFLEVAGNPSSIIVLDEAHVDLDARSFNSNHVKFITATSFYLRKIRATLILTSPLFENLDSRIRAITNVLCLVSKDKSYFYYEMYDPTSNKHLGTKKIRKQKAFHLNLYDTNAIVTQLDVPAKKEEFDKFLFELKQTTMNYYKKDKTDGATKALAFGGHKYNNNIFPERGVNFEKTY